MRPTGQIRRNGEGLAMEGLAAHSAGVTNTYGDGEGQNVKHYYAGVMKKKRKKDGKRKAKTNKDQKRKQG